MPRSNIVRSAVMVENRPVLKQAESPLAWLMSRRNGRGRRHISEVQFLAGERLRSDYEHAMLAHRVTANWEMGAGSGGQHQLELSDAALAARQRFHQAVEAVGPELSSILVQVCCLTAGIEQAERLLELPKRSGKAILCLGLTALARHYGLIRKAGRGSSRISGWSVPGYRPEIGVADG